MRGIVISPRFTFDGTILSMKGGVEAVDLRKYLLYWDKIVYPNNNVFHYFTSEDDQFLIDAGVMSRPDITINKTGQNVGYAVIQAQTNALLIKNREEPGLWSLAQSGDTLHMPKELSHETRIIEAELYGALPIPGTEVSLDDVLSFKHQRSDELLAFQTAMSQLYLDVRSSADIPRAKTVAIEQIERTLEDLHKVANESWTSKVLSNIKVQISVRNLAKSVAFGKGGAMYAASYGISPFLGATIGASSAFIKFDMPITQVPNGIPHKLKDFAYLYSIEKNLS